MDMMMKPLVSFIICQSGNKNRLLVDCIRSLKSQNYPSDRMEFLIMKGFMPEGAGGGKRAAWKMARGEFLAIVDEDNVICGPEWLNQMLEPLLEDETIVGSACSLLVDHKDPLINQYIALSGTDPVMAYRSLDGRFRSIKHKLVDIDTYYYFQMTKRNMLVTGGNCFIYRKSALDKIGGYVQDTDNIAAFVEKGICRIAIPKRARTHHFASSSIGEFLKKKNRWSKHIVSERWDYIRPSLFWEAFLNLTVIANIFKACYYYFRDGNEPAWSLHPLLAFLVTIIYTANYLKSKVS